MSEMRLLSISDDELSEQEKWGESRQSGWRQPASVTRLGNFADEWGQPTPLPPGAAAMTGAKSALIHCLDADKYRLFKGLFEIKVGVRGVKAVMYLFRTDIVVLALDGGRFTTCCDM